MSSKGTIFNIARAKEMNRRYYSENNPHSISGLSNQNHSHDWVKIELSYKVVFNCSKCDCAKENYDRDPESYKKCA